MVFLYAKNKKLLVFNEIHIKNYKKIEPKLFFEYINYNSDSINFYTNKDYNSFFKKTQDLKNSDGIIKNINSYYSLPNKIIFEIEEKRPSYLIKYNDDFLFALDDLGMIIDIDFLLSELSELREVELVFNDFYIYDTFNKTVDLNKVFKNIKKIKSNNQNLLDVFTILNSFEGLNLKEKIHSVVIDHFNIKINFLSTEILFNKNKNIKKQIEKLEIMVNNLDKNINQVNFSDISELKQIRLDIDEQIVYKEK